MTGSIRLTKPNTGKPGFYRLIRRLFRLFVSTRPALYQAYARLENLQFRLTGGTQIVVDSYPRSANSFFEAAFTRAHGGRIEVAHHSHAAAQVLSGVARGLPCIVLVREPEAAIASFYEMHGGHYPIWLCTQEYVAFYSALVHVLDKLIVVTTENLEARFFDLMVQVRDTHSLDIEPFEVDARVRAELFEQVDATGRARNGSVVERYSESLSSEEKSQRRANLDKIRHSIRSPRNAHRLAKANAVYYRFKSHAF